MRAYGMANDESICIEFVDGHSVGRRALAWLITSPANKHVIAKSVFEKLREKLKQDVHNRFDAWLAGKINDKWYHGWNEEGFRSCFVFKWKDNRQHHRLYGFLCHPKIDQPSFLLCVLTSHTTKNEQEADKSEKKRMNDLRNDKKVIEALKNLQEDCSNKENQ
jgi:hypothetical protein